VAWVKNYWWRNGGCSGCLCCTRNQAKEIWTKITSATCTQTSSLTTSKTTYHASRALDGDMSSESNTKGGHNHKHWTARWGSDKRVRQVVVKWGNYMRPGHWSIMVERTPGQGYSCGWKDEGNSQKSEAVATCNRLGVGVSLTQSASTTNQLKIKEVEIWVIKEEACDEALRGTKDAGYVGGQTKTRGGRTCQKWNSQSPHSRSNTSPGNHNYCRNPDRSSTIWCYTVNSNKRWEYCDPL